VIRKIRKSSGSVTLVLIGLAGLAGCGEDRRDVYASREDCLADWGNKPEDCTPATQPSHTSRGYFYGPTYTHRWWSSGGGAPRGAGSISSGHSSSSGHASGSSSSHGSTSRGGFGSSGHSSSS
jgi:hypothetical protein